MAGLFPPRPSRLACLGPSRPEERPAGVRQGVDQLPRWAGLRLSDSSAGPAPHTPAAPTPASSGLIDRYFRGLPLKTFYICEVPPPCHVFPPLDIQCDAWCRWQPGTMWPCKCASCPKLSSVLGG